MTTTRALAIALIPLVAVLAWFVVAALLTGTGCLWVMGYGGCVPWVETPSTV